MIAAERERWRAAQQCLAELLALPDDARFAHLESAGLEPGVHARVVRLLAAADTPDPRLEPGTGGLLVDPEPANRLAGRRVGDWELLEEIGRGGMALVYRARRCGQDYQQVAAVKLLGLASLGGGGAARFEQERRVLASLRHPHIAALVDGGVAEDGTPFLAMQLVDGVHIDAYCSSHALALAARVQLLVQVCAAVAHAHRNLVVHRDIKPANVLVTASGMPVLLDFGIAKLLDGDTEATRTGLRALTPGYAAPEQADGGPITTATDVFALGSVLRRITGDCEPLPRDLRNIIAMATRPEPERRYRDAAALSADLERWLQRRPVRASPDSAAYRLRLFLRRRRGVAIASAACVLLLFAGAAATLWQARRATLQAQHAEATRDFLLDLFRAADPLTSGPDPSLALLVDRGLQRIDTAFADSPLQHAEMSLVLAQLAMLDGQHARADELLARAGDQARAGNDRQLQARVLLQLGMLSTARGQPQEAVARLEQALVLGRGTPVREQVLPALAHALDHTGQRERAADMTREALEAVRDQLPADPDRRAELLLTAANYEPDPAMQLDLLTEAAGWFDRGSPTPYQRMVLDANLANAHSAAGDLDAAVAAARRAAATAARIYPSASRHQARLESNLGALLRKAGRPAEADAALTRAESTFRAIGDSASPSFAALLNNRAALLWELGRPADAVPLLEEAHALAAQHFGPADFRTGIVLAALARDRAEGGDARAEADWQRAWAIAEADPSSERRVVRLVTGAQVALALGQPALALQRLDRAAATDAADPVADRRWAISAAWLRGAVAAGQGAPAEARRHFADGLAEAEGVGRSGWSAAWRLHRSFGDLLRGQGDIAAARTQYQQALALLRQLGVEASEPPVLALQRALGGLAAGPQPPSAP